VTRTPASLLERLRVSPDDGVWERFVDLYGPLIYQWGRGRFQLAAQDAEDVTQDVLITVVREMPDFHYDPNGSFRAWLFRIVNNRVQAIRRARRPAVLAPQDLQGQVDDSQGPESALAQEWQQEHDRVILDRALELIRSEFEDGTWQAFWKTVMDNMPPRRAAAELGITANAARIAKFRVLRRLRQEIEGLMD
jgi:RNA polymerase sigma-70 factor (ECF subfamily)